MVKSSGFIHGTQHQQVKVEDHVGIEVPPGAPRLAALPCRPVPSALLGPAPGGPPTCRELRQRASGYGSATVPPAPGSKLGFSHSVLYEFFFFQLFFIFLTGCSFGGLKFMLGWQKLF